MLPDSPPSGLPASGFGEVDAPVEADLYRCVHCGLCLSACPTYTQLGVETESPRGRLALMKAVNEGRTPITDRIASHWDLCLQCRACEAVCPSGVPYGRIMEQTRAQVLDQGMRSDNMKTISRWFLRAALPHPGRLRFGAHLLRAYQRSGLQWLVRRFGLLRLLPGALGRFESQIPALGGRFFGPSDQVHPAKGARRMTVGLLSGCVMPLVHGDTMDASVEVLTRNGCDVVTPRGQGCCGSLNAHSGDLEYARIMARRNIDVFLQAGVDRVVVASAGCSSTMKEYGELLADDPTYSAKAEDFRRQDGGHYRVSGTVAPGAAPWPGRAAGDLPGPLPPGPFPANHQGAQGRPRCDTGPGAGGDGAGQHVLRERRILFDSAAGDVAGPAGPQDGPHRGDRGDPGGYGQPRLHAPDRPRECASAAFPGASATWWTFWPRPTGTRAGEAKRRRHG